MHWANAKGAAGLILTAAFVSACGTATASGSGAQTTSTSPLSSSSQVATSSSSTVTQATTPTDVAVAAEKMKDLLIHMKGTGASNQGATAWVTFSYGPPERASASMRDGLSSLGSVCSFDHQTAAVEPFLLGLANTTPHFNETPSVTVNIGDADMDARTAPTWHLYAETDDSSGPHCTDFGVSPQWGGSTTFGISASLKPGAGSGDAFGFLVIDGYYSPAHPNGDPQGLDHLLIDLDGGEDRSGDNAWKIQAPDLRDDSLVEPFSPDGQIK
jgi:hypothetical protein